MVIMREVYRLLPGVGLLLGLGLLARGVTLVVPWGNHLLVVIGLGLLVANTVDLPEWTKPGVDTHGLWLEAGIVLMGVSVALEQVIGAGVAVLLVVCLTVCATVLLVELLAREIFDIPEKIGSLLAAGSGICGVSAVVAVSGSIKPDRQQTAYAAATIVLFDVVTLVVYPIVGRILGLPDVLFGIWAGTTMFSTGPVTAAGFAYSRSAGEWAVLVKLARNALIGVLTVGYALYYSRRGITDSSVEGSWRYLWETFPKFIIGFVILMFLGSAGIFSASQVATLDNASSWLFLLAFAGLGLSIDVSELATTGVKPILVISTSLVTISTLVLLLLLLFF